MHGENTMSTGKGMFELAYRHIGEQYDHVLVPKNNPNWKGPWDCSEFISWIVFQDSGILYGCENDSSNPAIAKAYTGNWKIDSLKRGICIPVQQAAAIIGGIVLRFPPDGGGMGHIVICNGRGGTVEAKGHAFGVVEDTVQGRRWDTGILIPGVYYDTSTLPISIVEPNKIYYIGGPNMDTNVVLEIQSALLSNGLDPGPIDGIYGAKTSVAVAAFQQNKGLVVDGEVGKQTAEKLGIEL